MQAVGPFRCDAGKVKSEKRCMYVHEVPALLPAQAVDAGGTSLGTRKSGGAAGESISTWSLAGSILRGKSTQLASLRTRTSEAHPLWLFVHLF